MSIMNSGGPTALSGTVASTTPTGGGIDSAFNPLTSSNGAAFQAAQPGGVNLGPGTIGMSSSDYFIANYGPTGVTNPTSSAFSYPTGSLDNPDNPIASVAFSQVQIGGKWYSQIFLGTISFAVTGVTGTQQTATITPQNMTTAAGNASFWMEDGALYTSANGTINAQSVSITVSGNATQPGTVAVSGPTGMYSDLLIKGVTPLTLSVNNASSNPINTYYLYGTAPSGAVTLSTTTGSLAATTTSNVGGSYQAAGVAGSIANITPASVGSVTITGSIYTPDNGVVAPSATSTGTVTNVGAANAPSHTSFSGNVLKGDVAASGGSYAGLASIVTGGNGNLGTVAEMLGGHKQHRSDPDRDHDLADAGPRRNQGQHHHPADEQFRWRGLPRQRRGADRRYGRQRLCPRDDL